MKNTTQELGRLTTHPAVIKEASARYGSLIELRRVTAPEDRSVEWESATKAAYDVVGAVVRSVFPDASANDWLMRKNREYPGVDCNKILFVSYITARSVEEKKAPLAVLLGFYTRLTATSSASGEMHSFMDSDRWITFDPKKSEIHLCRLAGAIPLEPEVGKWRRNRSIAKLALAGLTPEKIQEVKKELGVAS
jgi:hypothetical protein